MEIETIAVAVDGPHSPVLNPTSATISSGSVTIVDGPPGAGHTAFSLLIGGRLVPSSGQVLIDGAKDGMKLRRSVAMVDVPQVSEPDEVVSLATTVGEDLAMAGLSARSHHVRRWLAERDAGQWLHTRVEDVPPEVRCRLLVELAASRPGVTTLVLCCPDRYGTDGPAALDIAHEQAEKGFGVCLQMTTNTVRTVGDSHVSLGGDQ